MADSTSGAGTPVPSVHIKQEHQIPANAIIKKESAADEPQAAETSTSPNSSKVSRNQILQEIKFPALESVIKSSSIETLEAAVETTAEVLRDLLEPMKAATDQPDLHKWTENIHNLLSKLGNAKAVIPVVGNTGAGKSSAINALLGEAKLVPTNCMRACTAVITEIAYNQSDDPEERYRAEIEFTSAEEWEKEVTLLFSEVRSSDGKLAEDYKNEESEAGVAYHKIKAVYPYQTRTKELLAACDPAELMRDPNVEQVLGMTKMIKTPDAASFFDQLQGYLDSVENHDVKKGRRMMAPWPLIKVVRVYVKSTALETGSVIVDLPGVQDANVARSSLAAKYIAQCSSLWIVAPINRAVDDKTAKNLLGNSFKLQLKLDGSYQNVTFICTKADDLSVSEAVDSLKLGPEIEIIENQLQTVTEDIEVAAKRIEDKISELAEIDKNQTTIEEELEKWDDIGVQIDMGKTPYPPVKQQRKRRRLPRASGNDRKRTARGQTTSVDDEGTESQPEEPSVHPILKDAGIVVEAKEAVTRDILNKVLKGLEDYNALLVEKQEDIGAEVQALETEHEQFEAQKHSLSIRPKKLCIQGRNEYSKTKIKEHFAAGIKELDEDAAQQEDEADFDPEDVRNDYDEIAEALPVFCISSKAFQQFEGHFKDEAPRSGFEFPEDTELPQLQKHLRDANVLVRRETQRAFLRGADNLFQNLLKWAIGDDRLAASLTPAQKKAEKKTMRNVVEKLQRGIHAKITTSCSTAKQALQGDEASIFSKLDSGVEKASVRAISVIQGWALPKKEGGLAAQSYKALCRRHGYKPVKGATVDWNEQLLDPLLKRVATGWARVFNQNMPQMVRDLINSIVQSLESSVADIQTTLAYQAAGVAPRKLLDQQMHVRLANLSDMARGLTNDVSAMQRDLNRRFKTLIQETMANAYNACAAEAGKGMFLRMKQIMADHVEASRRLMFRTAVNQVKKDMDKAILELFEKIHIQIDEVVSSLTDDLDHLLDPAPTQGLSQVHVNEIIKILQSVDVQFANVANEDPKKSDDIAKSEDIAKTEGSHNEALPSRQALDELPVSVQAEGLREGSTVSGDAARSVVSRVVRVAVNMAVEGSERAQTASVARD